MVCILRDLIHSKTIPKDNKYFYWLIGFLASSSIFIEAKKRRSELALYVIPRGTDALYQNLYKRRLVWKVPYFEVGMFCVAMGAVVAFFQTEPGVLSGVLEGLLGRVDGIIEDPEVYRKPRRKRLGEMKNEDEVGNECTK
jgi:hypothetical protein